MYMITQAERDVRIPPVDLAEDIDDVIDRITWKAYEGTVGPDKSVTILISNVKTKGPGRIVFGDEAVYQRVTFEQLVFKPKENEVIEGKVIQIQEFGAFVRFGPLDGLIHKSQVMDDRVDYDLENQRLIGKDTGRTLSKDDIVRARIVSLDFNETNIRDSRIGLTMRQPGLGKLEWIDEDNKKKGGA